MIRRIRLLALGAGVVLAALTSVGPASAAEGEIHHPNQSWSWEGLFGRYDHEQLRRGLKVYAEVCSACHGMRQLHYRHLADIGMSEGEIKAFLDQYGWQVEDGPDDAGDMFMRPARPADQFVSPYPNEAAARAANGGALPPDLSVMTKARAGGPDYLYHLLIAYEQEPPADLELMPGMYYNPAYPGGQIGMPQMITDDVVEYEDETPTTAHQIAADVTAFLQWAAEPELEERKNMGAKVMLFLIVFTLLMYSMKRRIWAGVH